MTTVVDKLVSIGIPRPAAENFVVQVLEMMSGYKYEMLLRAFPLKNVELMVELAQLIRGKKSVIDGILTLDQQDMVKWILLTGIPRPIPRVAQDLHGNHMHSLLSTNQFFV